MSKKCKNDAPGMRGYRSRNNDGRLRKKRNDTLLGTIEEQYDIDLGRRNDMKLGNYLDKIALDFSIEGLFLPYFFLLSSRQ